MADRKSKEQKPKTKEPVISFEKKKEQMREDIRRRFREAFAFEDEHNRRQK